MNDHEFDNFLNNAIDKTEDKNLQLSKSYKIGSHDRFDYDLPNGVIIFSRKVGLKSKKLKSVLAADITPIGTHVKEHDSYQWGWAADTFPEELISKSEKLKALAEVTKLNVFEKPKFECDETMAWEIACIACEFTQGQGIYRAPARSVDLYLIMNNIRPLN